MSFVVVASASMLAGEHRYISACPEIDKRAASVTLPPLLSGRKAVEAAPDKRVVAGIMGNLGALMMGAHGSLERALEYTESAIQAGLDSSMKNSEVVGGPPSYPQRP